ncbi:hypothetical protein [Streptomyces sp. NPDC056105]|uniref:hypothetical protein n=1 Tax=Streptomyces sp. NPDC056105 TaxID=3345714 RepID=UPI0035DCF48E
MRRPAGSGRRTADGVPIVREAKDMPELPLRRYQFTAEDDEATARRGQEAVRDNMCGVLATK